MAARTWIEVRDGRTGGLVARLGEHGDEEGDVYSSVWLDYEGTRVISGSLAGRRSHEWNVASGVVLKDLGAVVVEESFDRLVSATVHPNGDIWVTRGQESTRVDTNQHHVRALVLDASCSSLLAVTPGARVVEYSIAGSQVATYYPANLDAVAFSLDGRHVLGRRGSEVLQWPDRTPGAVIARARAAVHRTLTAPERRMFDLPDEPQSRSTTSR